VRQAAGLRTDFQISPQTRLLLRGAKWNSEEPTDRAGGSSSHPSHTSFSRRASHELLATLTQVLSNRAVNQIKVGYLPQSPS